MNRMESAPGTVENEEAFAYARVISELSILMNFMEAAVKLNVFDIIAKHGNEPVSASQIAASFPKQNVNKTPMILDRMLSLLASFSLIHVKQNSTERLYSLSPAGKYFVKHGVEGSFAPIYLISCDPVIKRAWSELTDAIIEGVGPCEKTFGIPFFQLLSQNHSTSKLFDKAMSDISNATLRVLLESYKGLNTISSLVDVGGGDGSCLKMIVSMNPHISGINFDLPQVVQHAPNLPGISHVGGDMFEAIPKGDAIILKSILHNWDDEHSLKLLKLCYDALPENGKVILIELILPDIKSGNSTAVKEAYMRDAAMFIFSGGKERTREQFTELSRASGFSDARFISAYAVEWIMEFHK